MWFGYFRWRCVCGSTRLRRSSRRSRRENLLRFLIRPWRCEDCDRRCFKASFLKPRGGKSREAGPGATARESLIDSVLSYTARIFDRGTSDLD